jgi:uncharacterized protein (TIGR02147 family)
MKGEKLNIDLFRYRDYRAFLRDWYAQAKCQRRGFSFRAFSKRAGFRSPNFLKLVMEGQRNLTEASLEKTMTGLGLNKQEQEFFRNLVFFNQARDHDLKDRHYRQMLKSRKLRRLVPIEKSRYEYYSRWYHAVVRELVISPAFDGTPEWIAKTVSPPMTKEEAARSIELLEKLDFIERDQEGTWHQKESLVSTGPESTSHILFHYHLKLIDLTKEILQGVSPQERDVSALTLGLRKEKFSELKQMVQEFRRDVLKFVSEEAHPEMVVQLNLQLYPVTKTEKGKKG